MTSEQNLAGTFSIVAYDPAAQEWGVAVQSRAFTVGGIVPWARAGVGAIATQAWANMSCGPRGLALLTRGLNPEQVVERLLARDRHRAQRQLAVVDARGRAANYTGAECLPWAGGLIGENYSVQGNILAGERVVTAMARTLDKSTGKLAARLLDALDAAQAAGGDRRGQQSAALLVVREKSDLNGVGDRYVDLRVDDHKKPLVELRRLYRIWERTFFTSIESHRINALLRERRYARAQRAHREFIAHAARQARRHPRDADLFNALAWMLAQNQLGLDAALRYARRAVKLRPRDANILDTLAEVYYRRGDYDRAIEIERALVDRHPERNDLARQLAKFEQGAR
jgi:uncharacterized Ntn-hydrolase superfamily protein